MRIGHYAPAIGVPGGIATYIRRLGRAQAARGHAVHYLSREPAGPDAAPETCPPDVQTVAGDADLFRQALALDLDVLHLHKSVAALPAERVPAVRTVHGHQASCPSGSRFLARSQSPCNRVPGPAACLWGRVVDRCGSVRPAHVRDNARRFAREVEQAGVLRTLPVSTFLRDRMIEAGCPAGTLETIHSPAPTVDNPAGPVDRNGPPRFLFLGRLEPQKGLLWLLRAFARLGGDARLDVAGTGALMPAARALAEAEGMAGRVAFHGWVGPEDVPALLGAARAVVFPSLWHEPAGLVSLEAAAYGRALVASDVGGIPEYAVEGHALLVRPNDTAGLADALSALAGDPDRADRMGAAGRRAATTRFSMDAFLDRLDAVYRSVQPAAGPVATGAPSSHASDAAAVPR